MISLSFPDLQLIEMTKTWIVELQLNFLNVLILL